MTNTQLYNQIMKNVSNIIKKTLNETIGDPSLNDVVTDLEDSMDTIVTNLKNRMNKGIVKFTFIKKDGSTREANGTTNPDIIRQLTDEPHKIACLDKAEPAKTAPGIVKFFDVEKIDWRNCKAENIVEVVRETPAFDITRKINSAYEFTTFDKTNNDIDSLRALLRQGVVYFTYIKNDGTEREFYATTMPSMIPQREEGEADTKPKRKYTPNPNIVNFYDITANGWRSAKFDQII